MSRVKEELIKDLTQKFGAHAGPMVEYLFDMGILDDVLARKHVVKVEVFRRMTASTTPERTIHEQVGWDYGLTRQRIHQLIGK